MEEVTVIPQEYGGDTAAFGIPFNVSPNGGGRTEGTVSVAERKPTFTPGTAAGASTQSTGKSGGSSSD